MRGVFIGCLEVWGFEFGALEFWYLGFLDYVNVGTLDFVNFGVLECWV